MKLILGMAVRSKTNSERVPNAPNVVTYLKGACKPIVNGAANKILIRKALITRAPNGIGEAFARKLASQDYDRIIVARREKRLAQLAHQLRSQ